MDFSTIMRALGGAGSAFAGDQGGGGMGAPLGALLAQAVAKKSPLGAPPLPAAMGPAAATGKTGPLATMERPMAMPATPMGTGGMPPVDNAPAAIKALGDPQLVDRSGGMNAQLGPLAAAQPTYQPHHGVFDRLGQFFGSDDGKAALFHAGATMLANGGNIGEGMLAGAGAVEHRKNERSADEHYNREMAQHDRGLNINQQTVDQSGLYQAGELHNSANRNVVEMLRMEELARKNRAGEALTHEEHVMLDNYHRGQLQLGYHEENGRMVRDTNDNAQSDANSQRSYNASIYGTDSTRDSAAQAAAVAAGPKTKTVQRDENGYEIGSTEQVTPDYGSVRYDQQGNGYRLDPVTGKPVLIPRAVKAR